MEKDGPCWRLESGSLDNLKLRQGKAVLHLLEIKNGSC